MTEQLLTAQEAAALLGGIPVRTLAQWRHKGSGPRWVRVGKHVRYRPSDLEAWVDAQTSGAPEAVAG